MAIYEYECPEHGRFEVIRPGGTATDEIPCRECGAASVRIMTGPRVKRTSTAGLYGALDHAHKSRFEPEVVSSLPSHGHRRPPPRVARMTPQLAGLPRP